MFAAVRKTLTGAWRNLREGSLAKLFLFEFVVVLLGVLAAQWVAEWAQERQLERQAQAAFDDAREAARVINNGYGWFAAKAPCMIDRTREVASAAANGGTMSRAEIGRPALPLGLMPDWNEDVRQAALKRFGPDKMIAIVSFEITEESMRDASQRLRNAWSTFSLLDPDSGTPSAADRHAVRLAAVQAADYLRFLAFLKNSRNETLVALQLGEPDFSELESVTDECGMLKGFG